jgi:NAD(P)-dependent dehydrogenase (short-subunit alcohol dehydrogenase family)
MHRNWNFPNNGAPMPPTSFGFENTTDDVLEGVDLTGKTALVTGASTGLGAETTRALASKGARVILVARNLEKLKAMAASISESTGNSQLSVLQCDLGRFASIREAAAQALEMAPSLDLLINNAGVMACPLGRTAEGHEMQFGTNHLGHFLLTCLLVPALEASGDARIINLSSGGHKYCTVELDDWNFETGDYDKWQAYGRSKTANAQFAVALDKRLSGRGVRAFRPSRGHRDRVVSSLDARRHQDDDRVEPPRRETLHVQIGSPGRCNLGLGRNLLEPRRSRGHLSRKLRHRRTRRGSHRHRWILALCRRRRSGGKAVDIERIDRWAEVRLVSRLN